MRPLPAHEAVRMAPGQRYVRGLYSGGTLCYEALLLLRSRLCRIWSNTPLSPAEALDPVNRSREHTVIDMGGGTFTQGRLHPMLDPTLRQRILSENNVFPFSFTSQPFSARVQVSLPIFDAFNRDLSVAQARAQRDDQREFVRARTLQVRTDVQARHLALQTAYRAIAVQAANRDAARDQLRLAQDRYRLGSGSALEISDAQNAVQRAEGDYVNAVYDYHKAIAALELAVGRPLR